MTLLWVAYKHYGSHTLLHHHAAKLSPNPCLARLNYLYYLTTHHPPYGVKKEPHLLDIGLFCVFLQFPVNDIDNQKYLTQTDLLDISLS